MKQTITRLVAVLLTAGSASAASVSATDGGTTVYGSTDGIEIDFDSTSAPLAIWSPSLVNGQTYSLNSLGVRNGAATATEYLGVYTGLSGNTLSGFLGASDSAIDFSTITSGNWATFTFSSINVTVDSTVGSGSGLLYFIFQPDAVTHASNPDQNISLQRFDSDTTVNQSLASIYALGAIQTVRSPEYQATLTPVPEPTSLALLGFSGAMALFVRRHLRA